MWRKPTEARPNPGASNTPAPANTPEKAKQAQGVPQQVTSSSASAVGNTPGTVAVPDAAGKSAVTPAPSGTSAAATPSASSNPSTPSTSSGPAKSAPVVQAAAPVAKPVRVEEPSTISAGLKIKGDITGTSDLTIDGETQGKVRLTNGRVTIGPSGKVIADIDAREIVVNGMVQGNLKATESVRLGPTGHVEGSILTARIGIDDGARLRGNVEMIRAGEANDASRQQRPEPPQAARAATAVSKE